MNNGTLNCQESIMLALQEGLHKDLGTFHQMPPRETQRDIMYVRNRAQAEGLEFLTKTLPLLAKALDRALLDGNFLCPSNFKRYRGTKLPCFMHGFFERVFDKEGQLLEDADISCITDIRQVGYLFYKYQLPYHDRLVSSSIKEFIADDESVMTNFTGVELESIIYYAQEVVNVVLRDINLHLARPRNGPGSVANGLKPWQRYKPSRFYPKLDGLISYDRFYYCSDRHLFDHWDEWFGLESHDTGATARLMAVPKDSRGPRLISSEQSEFMTYQQNMRMILVPHIETHPLTKGQVNFADQTINGSLALASSKTGDLATLDLSKASDLLSLDLVDALFEDTAIHRYLMDSRSTFTRTPFGDQRLRKFAPMGSALCFPIQALTFYALLVGRMVANGERLGVAAHKVWVYGDDIIVPIDFVPEAIDVLESVGLRVNYAKSCYTGHFRESCGVDAFKGVNITPIKLKKVWNTRPDAQSTIAWVAMCNQLFARGYWQTADVIRRRLDRQIGKLPLCTSNSPIIGYHTWSTAHVLMANRTKLRWNHDLQTWTIRAKIAANVPKRLLNCGWKRLLRYGWERQEQNDVLPDQAAFSTDAFVERNTTKIKYSVVTEASM